MKLLLCNLFGLYVTVSLAGCGGTPSKETAERGVIGVSLLKDDDPFFIQMSKAMQEQGHAAEYEVLVTFGNENLDRQKQQIEDFIQRRVDAIVLCPLGTEIATAIRKANGVGIPVFTADIALLAEGVEIVSHVATDNYRGGQLAANAMFESLGGNGHVAIVDHPTVDSAILRARGFVQRLEELRQHSDGTIKVMTQRGRHSRIRWFADPETILRERPDVKGIFALTDNLALSVVSALEKQNKLDDVQVVGFDGQPAALEALDAGKIAADVIQHPELIAEMVIRSIVDYNSGKDVPAEQLISPTIRRFRD